MVGDTSPLHPEHQEHTMAVIDVEDVPVRSGATADWAAATAPVLGVGEVGIDNTTRELKVGDGTTAFADLPSLTPTRVTATLAAGAVTITDAKIKAASRIVPVVQALGTVTAAQALRVARSAGVSYTITSAAANDTSTIEVYVWH